jgi:type IV pilus assembly protein PilQ
MMHRMFAAGLMVAVLSPFQAFAEAGKISKVELVPGKDKATLSISYSGGGKFRLFQSEKQGSVIVEAENLTLSPSLTKMLDSSAAAGPVLQLTPYNSTHGSAPMAKFVIQLRGRADVTSQETAGRFTVDIVRKPAFPGLAMNKAASERDQLSSRQAANEKKEDVAKKLVEVLNSPDQEKSYFGSRVTFAAKDVEVPDVFRLVGESSDLNIIWDTEVESAKTSLAVKDLPWDQLLDIVIQQKGFKALVMGNVVRITTLDIYNKQAELHKQELLVTEELEPVVMAVIPLSFAEAATMKTLITELIQDKNMVTGTAQTVTTTGGTQTTSYEKKLVQDFKRGRLEVDTRTNSLVVTNTKDSIDRIRRLIKELDVPVPQILIDSKIIIASENFSRQVGVRWQQHVTSESGAAGVAGAFGQGSNEVLGGGSTAQDAVSSFTISSGPGSAAMGIGFGAGNRANLKAMLDLAEINGISKTVASPRVIVNNNKPASITDGQTITQLVAGQGPGGAGRNEVSAKLSLSLTPQVTSRGSVQLKSIKITKDSPVANDTQTTKTDNKSLETEVLVDSGATLVLGGIYQMSALDAEGGIPVLKDLPFIGQLFRVNNSSYNKSELMVFITPQIIDPEANSQGL